jgi:hypothetical protein
MYALKNAKIFTSEDIIENQVLLIEGDKVSKILSEENLDSDIQVIDLKGLNIAPSFIVFIIQKLRKKLFVKPILKSVGKVQLIFKLRFHLCFWIRC